MGRVGIYVTRRLVFGTSKREVYQRQHCRPKSRATGVIRIMANNPDGSAMHPMFFYVVNDIDGVLHGYQLDHKPAWELEKGYEVVYHFRGREATYWIATHDRSIERKEALQFASDCHTGRVRRFNCDLSGLGR